MGGGVFGATHRRRLFGARQEDAASNGASTTTATTYQPKLTLTTENLIAGRKYRIGWQCELMNLTNGENAQVRVKVDGGIKAHGTVTTAHSPSQPLPLSGIYYFTPVADGPVDILIEHRVEPGSTGTSSIKRARVEKWRGK